MEIIMKKIISLILVVGMFLPFCCSVSAEEKPFDVNAKSAILMEASTGQVLYSKYPDDPLPPASVTKVMTLLLVMEAIDRNTLAMSDTVTVSEYAASMGGSQVYLEPFEEMTVEDMLKSVVIASANDAAVALAEKVAGSEEAFVNDMNEKAKKLGMKSTSFENVTGLDDDTKNHVTSARDIAIMSRELITKHPAMLNYSSIWMDSIRNGEFGLTNTNRLVRFYKGATGLKTGSTSKAGFCMSATAERDGMDLIAVIMGSDTRDTRNAAAATLLDWGFATYSVYKTESETAGRIKVTGGCEKDVEAIIPPAGFLLKKTGGEVEKKVELNECAEAPVKKGDVLGKITYECKGTVIGESEITAARDVEGISYFGVLIKIIRSCFCL